MTSELLQTVVIPLILTSSIHCRQSSWKIKIIDNCWKEWPPLLLWLKRSPMLSALVLMLYNFWNTNLTTTNCSSFGRFSLNYSESSWEKFSSNLCQFIQNHFKMILNWIKIILDKSNGVKIWKSLKFNQFFYQLPTTSTNFQAPFSYPRANITAYFIKISSS